MAGGTRSRRSGRAVRSGPWFPWKPENLFYCQPVGLCRTGKDGYIQVDGGAAVHGQSRGRSTIVNTKGDLYLGESPASRPAPSEALIS